jgi:hypothetical protein
MPLDAESSQRAMTSAHDRDRIEAAMISAQAWLEQHDFAGWDPFDMLNSPWLRTIGSRNRLAGIAIVQMGKRSPFNMRRILGVPHVRNAKAIGLALSAYVQLLDIDGSSGDVNRIRDLTTWLSLNRSSGYAGACWGYPFDWPSRSLVAPSGTPSVVTTYFCATALLRLALAAPRGGLDLATGVDALVLARSACDFIMTDLNRLPDRTSSTYFSWSYTPLDRRPIHNANVLGARLLAEVGAATGEQSLKQLALDSAYYTATRQRPDGSWPYGEDGRNSWVDSFHTAYVVSSLLSIANLLQDDFLLDVALKGYKYWSTTCFLADSTPKWGPHRIYPIDIHSAAQAVISFLDFAPHDESALASAKRVALWTLAHMQTREGHFAYQQRRFYRIDIPYARWSQAWMFNALVALLIRMPPAPVDTR